MATASSEVNRDATTLNLQCDAIRSEQFFGNGRIGYH